MNISQNKDTSMNDVENQVCTTNVATVKKEEKDVIIPTIALNVPTRSFLDRATSFPVVSPHFQMVPKVVANEEKVENKKVIDDKMEETSSPVVQKSQEESSSNKAGTQNLPKKLCHLEENENLTKYDILKSKEEEKSVMRKDIPSETLLPSKSLLSLEQCVNIIRNELHIEETSVGAVIRLALDAFDSSVLTDMCDKQRNPLHKTHIIITEGLGMSLNDKSV
jgi:hypothetical protein